MGIELGDKVEILADKTVEIHGYEQHIDIQGQHVVGTVVDIHHREFGRELRKERWVYTVVLSIPLLQGVELRCQVMCKDEEIGPYYLEIT